MRQELPLPGCCPACGGPLRWTERVQGQVRHLVERAPAAEHTRSRDKQRRRRRRLQAGGQQVGKRCGGVSCCVGGGCLGWQAARRRMGSICLSSWNSSSSSSSAGGVASSSSNSSNSGGNSSSRAECTRRGRAFSGLLRHEKGQQRCKDGRSRGWGPGRWLAQVARLCWNAVR